MLSVTQLEDRLTPAVNVYVGIVMPNPVTGEPREVIRLVIGDPQHSPGHAVELPDQSRGRFDSIWVGA